MVGCCASFGSRFFLSFFLLLLCAFRPYSWKKKNVRKPGCRCYINIKCRLETDSVVRCIVCKSSELLLHLTVLFVVNCWFRRECAFFPPNIIYNGPLFLRLQTRKKVDCLPLRFRFLVLLKQNGQYNIHIDRYWCTTSELYTKRARTQYTTDFVLLFFRLISLRWTWNMVCLVVFFMCCVAHSFALLNINAARALCNFDERRQKKNVGQPRNSLIRAKCNRKL